MQNMQITLFSRIRSLLGNQRISFAVIDIETAAGFDADYQPICAIAVCCSNPDGTIQPPIKHLVRPPENKITPETIAIHGITPEMTADAPDFRQVWEMLAPLITGRVLVAHNADFDFGVIETELKRNQITPPSSFYACTLDMARVAWPKERYHGLHDLTQKFDIELDHHDPASDAVAAAKILNLMMDSERRQNPLKLAEKLGVAVGVLGHPPRWKMGLRPYEREPHFRKHEDRWVVCAPLGILREGCVVKVSRRSGDHVYVLIIGEAHQIKASAGGMLEYVFEYEDIKKEVVEDFEISNRYEKYGEWLGH